MYIRKEYIAKCGHDLPTHDNSTPRCEHEERAETPEKAAERMWNHWFRAHYDDAEKQFREWQKKQKESMTNNAEGDEDVR